MGDWEIKCPRNKQGWKRKKGKGSRGGMKGSVAAEANDESR